MLKVDSRVDNYYQGREKNSFWWKEKFLLPSLHKKNDRGFQFTSRSLEFYKDIL